MTRTATRTTTTTDRTKAPVPAQRTTDERAARLTQERVLATLIDYYPKPFFT